MSFVQYDSYRTIDKLWLRLDVLDTEYMKFFGQYMRARHFGFMSPGVSEEAKQKLSDWDNTFAQFYERWLHNADSHVASVTAGLIRDTSSLCSGFLLAMRSLPNGAIEAIGSKTFARIAAAQGTGFAALLTGEFYCTSCDQYDRVSGLMLNNSYLCSSNMSSDATAVRNYLQHYSMESVGNLNLGSCPACAPANWDLGTWRRTLRRQPNQCTCRACVA